MARKYILGGKVYEETGSRKVIVAGKILEETTSALPTAPFPLQLPKNFHPDFAIPRKKPISSAEIDTSSSLSTAQQRFYYLYQGNDSPLLGPNKSEVNSSYTGPLFTVNGARTDASDETGWIAPGAKTSFPLTSFFGVRFLGAPDANHALWVGTDGATGNGQLYLRYAQASNAVQLLKSQVALIDSFSVDLEDNLPHFFGVVASSSTSFKVFLDGKLIIDVPSSGSTVDAPTSSHVIGREGTGATSDHSNAEFFFWNELDVAVSDDYAKTYTSNPYQLLKPKNLPMYFIPTVAPIGWLGTINGVLNPAKINGILVANILKVNEVASS